MYHSGQYAIINSIESEKVLFSYHTIDYITHTVNVSSAIGGGILRRPKCVSAQATRKSTANNYSATTDTSQAVIAITLKTHHHLFIGCLISRCLSQAQQFFTLFSVIGFVHLKNALLTKR